MRLRFSGAAAAAAAILGLSAPMVWAQNKCQEFRAVSQMQFGAGWWGPTFATLDGEVLITPPSAPPTEIAFPPGTAHGVVGMDYRGAKYLYDFGNGDSFVLESKSRAVYPHPSGKIGMGYYRATYMVVEGKGRFAGASGVVSESGPYLLWTDSSQPVGLGGRYNGEFNGSVCLGK